MGGFINDISFDVVKRGLDLSNFKHQIIADNVSNVGTPGYIAKKFNFENLLKDKINHSGSEITMDLTSRGHMAEAEGREMLAQYVTNSSNGNYNSIGNNVNIEEEMSGIAENSLYYETLTNLANRKIRILRNAISGRV